MHIKDTTLFYITNDYERALGLEKVIDRFHIVTIDYNNSIKTIRDKGINIFCLEEELGRINPIFRNSNRLLNHPKVIEYIERNSTDKDSTYLQFFKIASNSEITTSRLGYKKINSTSALNQLFELKISQYRKLHKLNYFPYTIISKVSKLHYDQLVDRLGVPFVIQYDRGHSGSSTVFIDSEDRLSEEKEKFSGRECKVSQYVDGEPFTINACNTRFGVVYGGLSYQLTGIKGCTNNKGATVGNNWSKELDSGVLEQIRIMTEDIGEIMYRDGYYGLFGLDIVVKDGLAYLIEVNARQTASVGMHTKLMLKSDYIPLQLFNIAEYVSENYEEFVQNINYLMNTNYTLEGIKTLIKEQSVNAILPIEASQLIIRNSEGGEIRIKHNFQTGIYRYIDGKLAYVRDGYCIDDIIKSDEIYISAASAGRVVSEENELARVQALFDITRLPDLDALISKVLNMLIK